jgi:hypothetical protein
MSVASLECGQRVYVLRDESEVPIGIWGTVVRLRRSDDGAWVRLDRRHERCPFPADDATRGTNILTCPENCSSVARADEPARSGASTSTPPADLGGVRLTDKS